MHSLLARIMAAFFISTVAMVIALSLIINYQVSSNFSHYLYMYHGAGMHGRMGADMAMMMGRPEVEFIMTLRRSLLLVGVFMTVVGIAVSYYLARGISTPVAKLNTAVNAVAKGNLDIVVPVNRVDEIGQLAESFNSMTASLKSNNLLRQRFLAGIVHELLTPLAILKANLEGIEDGVVHPDAQQIASLTEEVDRLAKIVEDLRDLSLIDAGQMRLEFSTLNVNDTLAGIVDNLKPLAAAKNINLCLDLPQQPVTVWADPARFRQIVYNLVINAVRYTEAGGAVKLLAASDGVTSEITVKDTGVGIPPENLPHIFDHFYRVDPSRSKNSGGTGLGLAIVRQLACAQGGSVRVESQLSKGSTFYLTLPVKNP